MNVDSELPVIHAAGAPKMVIYKPIIIVAALAALITIVVGNFIEPYSRQAARNLVAEARADLLSIIIQEGSFKEIDKNVYMQVAKRLPGGLLGGLFIADSRDAKTDLIYYAQEGAVVKQDGVNLLLMKNGEIHRKSTENGQITIIRFSSYAFDLSEFTAASAKPFLFPKDQTTGYLMSPDPNDKTFQKQPLLFRAELHRRFSEWLYPFVFALIAIGACAGARSHRQSSLVLMVNAIAFAFILRWFGLAAENYAEKSRYAVPFIYIVPLIGILLTVWLSVRNQPIALPTRFYDGFENSVANFSSRVDRLKIWLAGLRNRNQGAAS
jgi:lipopolysaccharide export system permease protein